MNSPGGPASQESTLNSGGLVAASCRRADRSSVINQKETLTEAMRSQTCPYYSETVAPITWDAKQVACAMRMQWHSPRGRQRGNASKALTRERNAPGNGVKLPACIGRHVR